MIQEEARARDGARCWPALDGLRAIAIAVVFLLHLPMTSWRGGYVGVNVFFCLSGFLITTVLCADADVAGHRGVRVGRFFARRLYRLYPAALFGLVVAVPVVVLTARFRSTDFVLDAISAVTYTFNLRRLADAPPSVVYQYWSLAVEEQFYLAWAPAVAVLHRRFGLGGRALRATLLAFAVAAIVKAAVAVLGPDAARNALALLLPGHVDELLLGAALAFAVRTGHVARLPEWLRRSPWPSAGAVVTIALLAWRLPDRYDPWIVAVGWLGVATLTAIVIVHVVASPAPTWFTRALSLAPLRWLGRRSYACYVLHVAVIHVAILLVGLDLGLAALTSIAATLLLAELSWRLLEAPALRRRDRSPRFGRAEVRPAHPIATRTGGGQRERRTAAL